MSATGPEDLRGPVDLLDVAEGLDELWSPRVVAQVADQYVKVARVHGAFPWHAHEGEDELFLILSGSLRLEIEGAAAVELSTGQVYVVPAGVRHRPIADEPCAIALIEPVGTKHTGDVDSPLSRSIEEQLG